MNAERALLRDSVERFAETAYTFDARRDLIAQPPGAPGCWERFAGFGWLGLPFDEADGGFGGAPEDVAILMRRFGRSLVIEPFLANVVLAGGLLARLGTVAQRARWLAPMIEGRTRLALAHGESQSRHRIADCLLRAERSGNAWTLSGRKSVVLGGAGADAFVVLGRTAGARQDEVGLSLFIVAAGTPGLSRTVYRTFDGHDACDLEFDAVAVGADALLGPVDGAFAELDRILDHAAALSCAEAVGVLEALFEDTLDYVKQRRQFGRPIAANQALQHRLVDMRIQLREAEAMAAMAVESLSAADRDPAVADARAQAVSAAKVHVGQALRLLAQEAVQMHGAIGTTDETRISHHFRRATALAMLFGDVDTHRRRFGLMRFADGRQDTGLADALCHGDADRRFVEEIRAFVRENLPEAVARKVANEQSLSKDEHQQWMAALGRRGWLAYGWPKSQGGPGWTARQQFLFDAVCVEMDCPWILPFGTRMLGPVLHRFGSEAQKARFLPGILDASELWCQGYSEPNAGSDLASLSTRAERRGDRYVVNGQKIWTSYAHWADWIFCLVRTSREEKSQQGISFLLIDMKTPGIEVRPIVSMDGLHSLNEVFFTDVEVPVEHRIGDEGAGWTCAKYLLTHERLENAGMSAIQRTLRRLRAIVADPGDGQPPLHEDPAFRDKLVDAEIRARALGLRVLGFLQRQDAGEDLGPEVSELKIRGTELLQRVLELIVEASGPQALPLQRDFMRGVAEAPLVGSHHAATAAGRYFNRRAASIFGGSNEIQHNVLAKAVLGL